MAKLHPVTQTELQATTYTHIRTLIRVTPSCRPAAAVLSSLSQLASCPQETDQFVGKKKGIVELLLKG